MNACNNKIPHTPGSPKIPLPVTVHPLGGIFTPVNFWVIFIKNIAEKPSVACIRTDLINLWLFICNISKARPHSDSQTIANIPRAFIKSPCINIHNHQKNYV